MEIFAIDPGTEQSGYACVVDCELEAAGVRSNNDIRLMLSQYPSSQFVIEDVACYGMPVGRDVFQTVKWIGRFWERIWQYAGFDPVFVERRVVKMHLCNSVCATDANVRRAVIDRFEPTGDGKIPQIGTKSQPGPLYGIKSHAWQALALAVTYAEVMV